jgi:hypothetical protein
MEDIDETVLNYAEVKAIASGNPLIKRKMELDLELQRLQILEAQYRAERYSLEDSVLKRYPANLAGLTEKIKSIEADIQLRDRNSGEDFSMTLGKRSYTERKDAGEALLKMVASNQYADQVIGKYRGFEMVPDEKRMLTETSKLTLKGSLSYTIELSESDVGSIARIENGVKGLENLLERRRKEFSDTENQLAAAKMQLTRPFGQEQELQAVLAELVSVNAELDIDKHDDIVAATQSGLSLRSTAISRLRH